MNFLILLHKCNSNLYPTFPSPAHKWEDCNLPKAYHGQNMSNTSVYPWQTYIHIAAHSLSSSHALWKPPDFLSLKQSK